MGKTTKTTTKTTIQPKGGTPTPTLPGLGTLVVTPTPTTPPPGKGVPSTIPNPVGVVWGVGYLLTVQGKGLVPRNVHTQRCYQMGVNPNTTRTQVQQYRKWYGGGCVGKVPKSVVVPTGGWVHHPGTYTPPKG